MIELSTIGDSLEQHFAIGFVIISLYGGTIGGPFHCVACELDGLHFTSLTCELNSGRSSRGTRNAGGRLRSAATADLDTHLATVHLNHGGFVFLRLASKHGCVCAWVNGFCRGCFLGWAGASGSGCCAPD